MADLEHLLDKIMPPVRASSEQSLQRGDSSTVCELIATV